MATKIPLVAVSYLNTKPFLYGLSRSPLAEILDIRLEAPADCAIALSEEQAAIGLVPVALLADTSELEIIGDYCIGAHGNVHTVSLFSHCALPEIRRIYLDYQSRTSVALTRILAAHYWHINPEFVQARKGFEQDMYAADEAVVIIGDRAIGQNQKYEYEYDLSAQWQQWQNLPFVFAAWVARKTWLDKMAQDNEAELTLFLQNFNSALSQGLAARREIAALWQPHYPTYFDVSQYFDKAIQYDLDAAKRKALAIFLDLLRHTPF
jgi:chorismate dehydratase